METQRERNRKVEERETDVRAYIGKKENYEIERERRMIEPPQGEKFLLPSPHN